jgi:hypothetical protein
VHLLASATTLTASDQGATTLIEVPAGALPTGTTVSFYPITNTAVLTADLPSGQTNVLDFAVTWETPSGSAPTATSPITVTVEDPNIVAGDVVYIVTASGLTLSGTAISAGSVELTFEADPVFLAAAKAVQSALLVTTTSGTVGTALSLSTSGGSGAGSVSFSVTNGTARGCQLSGESLTASAPGTCVVTATRAGDATYAPTSSTATFVSMTLPSRPALVRVSFASASTTLSSVAKRSLLVLAKKLVAGASVTVTGYAMGNRTRARHRALEAANYLKSHSSIHVIVKTSSALKNTVTVTTDKQ